MEKEESVAVELGELEMVDVGVRREVAVAATVEVTVEEGEIVVEGVPVAVLVREGVVEGV